MRRECLSTPILLVASALLLFAGQADAFGESLESSSEADLFARLFGEALPVESPDDILLLETLRIEKPDSFTEGYIASFARELKIGETYSRAELAARIATIDVRLRRSGMFYSSKASYRSLEAVGEDGGPRRVEAIVAVSEGFHWGFNFSPWDLELSYGNLAHAGKAAAAKLGLNTQELFWADPSMGGGILYNSARIHHSLRLGENEVDPGYLAELVRGEAGIGIRPIDDLKIGIGAGYLGIGSPASYFLYPGYVAPSSQELSSLGLSSSRSDYAEASFDLGLFEYSFKEEGGLKARLALGARAYLPLSGDGGAAIKLFADGALRYGFASTLSLALYGRVESFPWAKSSGDIPAPLRADLAEARVAGGLSSGEFASTSRLSLDWRLLEQVGLGFTSLDVAPQLYYELAFARRESFSSRPAGQQGCGLLLQFAFSPPVGRVFSLGLGLGLPGLPGFIPADAARDRLSMKLVFEVR